MGFEVVVRMYDRHPFSWPIRVYYEDTDAGGLVYHANYIKYFERARTELLRRIGVSQQVLFAQRIGFVVRHMEIDFVKGAKLDDSLIVNTVISQCRRASLSFCHELVNANNKRLCSAKVKIACIDIDKMKPQPIPLSIRSEILSER